MRTLLLLLSLALALQPAITATDGSISGADVYLTVNNPTMYDIYVVKATSDVAGKIELRDGEKATKELTVPSYGQLELKAGGPHLVLMDLKRPLKSGETIEITLSTDAGITVSAKCRVQS